MSTLPTNGSINIPKSHPPAMRQAKAAPTLILPYSDPWWREELSVKKSIASGEDVHIDVCC